jgi:hypothetical protein
MRYRLMATYRGAPYEAGVGPADGSVVLFAACPPPEELGFEPATGHWRKELRLGDVQAVWQSRPVGRFRGERCIVLDDLGDRLHIGYLGHDAYRAEELGYWQVDRGVFELVAARDEVTDIVEERTDYPGPGGSGSYTSPLPVTADYGRADPRSGPQPAAAPAVRPGPPAASPGLGGPGSPSGPSRPSGPGYLPGPGRSEAGRRVPADSGVAMPPAAAGPPLPLEAEALRAASASSSSRRDLLGAPVSRDLLAPPGTGGREPLAGPLNRDRLAAAGSAAVPGGAAAPGHPVPPGGFAPAASSLPAPAPLHPAPVAPPVPAPVPAAPAATAAAAPPAWAAAPVPRRRRSAGQRTATEQIFSDLASVAAIPASSYSVGEEVDGAMCLLQTANGFEVFSCSAGARHEVRVFSDEESACFYLFGVLAAEAVRTGALAPAASRGPAAFAGGDGLPRR